MQSIILEIGLNCKKQWGSTSFRTALVAGTHPATTLLSVKVDLILEIVRNHRGSSLVSEMCA